jgi:hypothetical protein
MSSIPDARRWLAARRRALVLAATCLTLAPVVATAQDTAGVALVRGAVVDAGGRPAPDVALCVAATGQCDVTGSDGRFTIPGVRAGRYQLEVIAPGTPAFLTQEIDVRAGLEAIVDVALPETVAVAETVTVTAPTFAFPEEVRNSGYLVTSTEILSSAGALQDVSRYAQTLPGVAIATADFRNDLIVRGGSPLENLYIVDNVEIPNLNSFATFASAGGTVSMLDAALVQDMTFLTGGYPAAYGNRTSSVMQITQREGNRSRLSARGTFGYAGAGVIAEGPLGRGGRGSWIVSARRSLLDVFTDDVGIGGVPVLSTLNAKAVYDLSPRDRLWLVTVGGVDEVRLGLTENSDLEDELSNLDIRYEGSRNAAGVNWQRLLGTRSVGLLGITYSRAAVNQRVNDLLRAGVPAPGTPVEDQLAGGELVFREASTESETTVKYDLTTYLGAIGKLQGGGAIKRQRVRYDAASPYGTDSPFFPIADVNPFALDERTASYQTSAYLQGTRSISDRLSVTIGGRLDHYEYLDSIRISPRAAVDYALTTRLSVRGSWGRYAQQPFPLFVAAYPENRQLRPFEADHYVAGVQYTTRAAVRVTAEVYRKVYRDYPVSSQIGSLSLANVGDTFAIRDILFPMVSAGSGQVDGVELFAERKPGVGRWHGQANLAVSRARHAGLDGVLRSGSFDYPVIANLAGAYRLSPAWEVSTRAAYLRGRPFTPFDMTASTTQRRAVYDLALVNAERVPDYFRLDLRIDRRFRVGGDEVSVFGGVQNVTNRRNLAGYSWDRRQNAVRVNEQLGIFPIVGIDWVF